MLKAVGIKERVSLSNAALTFDVVGTVRVMQARVDDDDASEIERSISRSRTKINEISAEVRRLVEQRKLRVFLTSKFLCCVVPESSQTSPSFQDTSILGGKTIVYNKRARHYF